VGPIPLKFLSKEGQNSTLRAAILGTSPRYPTTGLVERYDVTDKRPGCQVRFKMAARTVEFWPSLERNFSGIGCILEAKTTVSNSTSCYLFIGDLKKYTVSGVTFSFKTLIPYLNVKLLVQNLIQQQQQREQRQHLTAIDYQVYWQEAVALALV